MSPPVCQLQHATALGTGLSGGALTKDTSSIGFLVPGIAVNVLPTAGLWPFLGHDVFDDMFGEYPLTFALNEGFTIEARASSVEQLSVYFDISWAELSVPNNF